MDAFLTAKLLNQTGLFLGLISGLLLIPEVFNLLPVEKLEKSIERQLSVVENWSRWPLSFSPPSWRRKYTPEEREALEPITAIRSLMFSFLWIALLLAGLRYSSKFFVVLSLLILIAVALGNIAIHLTLWRFMSPLRLILVFFRILLILVIVTPLFSLLRVIMLIVRPIIHRMHSFFTAKNVFRVLLTILAIVTFIISNVLQFVATFYE